MTAEQVTNYDSVVNKLAGNLPSIPVLVNDMMKVVSDPSAATFALCDIIQKDQSVYAKILRIANSVEFRQGRTDRITEINDAVLRIGTENVRRTLLSTSVLEGLGNLSTLLQRLIIVMSIITIWLLVYHLLCWGTDTTPHHDTSITTEILEPAQSGNE